MMKLMRVVACGALALAVLLSAIGAAVSAQGALPFTAQAPQGFAWWCSAEACLLLPSDARPGSQARFFLVSAGNRVNALLIAWMGGGDVIWQGGIKASDLEWQAKLARGNGRRAFAGSNGEAWTFAAVSPENQWGQDAIVYNALLRGVAQ
jgi:hypothetical protein